jgi:hypothetical protein
MEVFFYEFGVVAMCHTPGVYYGNVSFNSYRKAPSPKLAKKLRY